MTNAVSLAQQASTGVSQGFKNRIINGAMVIDQRNAGASVSIPNTASYTVDRWQGQASVSSKYTVQQNAGSVTPPAGFTNYLGVTSSAATTVGAGDYYFVQQIVEGYNMADLNWGSANAKTITISFWVRSSLTGTFGGCLENSGATYNYPFTYTISSANTWEYKTVTIAGPTSGTWLSTNVAGIFVIFGLGIGSTYSFAPGSWTSSVALGATGATSVVGTNGATFYITGVQLEVGSTATSFDYRSYGTELQLCQRYYETNYPPGTVPGSVSLPGFVSTNSSSGSPNEASGVQFSVKKRATPTVTIYNATSGASGQVYRVSDAASISVTPTHVGSSGIGFLALGSSSANGYYWNYTASAEL